MNKIFMLGLAMMVLASCGSKKGDGGTETDAQAQLDAAQTAEVPRFRLLTAERLPQEVDLTLDITACSLQELVLLRNYVYAVHGCYFIEAEVERFFEQRTDWYRPMVEDLCENRNTVLDYRTTKLSKAERDFVGAIDVRINELMSKAEQPGSGLADPSVIKTLWQFEDIDAGFMKHLAAHNFAIAPTEYEQLFNIYEENDYRQVGNFVTTDLMLQLYHMFFVYAQKSLEKSVLRQRLSDLCRAMTDVCNPHDWDQYSFHGDRQLEELGRYAMAYFGVAQELLGEEALYKDAVQQELANIKAGQPAISPLLQWDMYFPYDMFKPRGYYDREEWSRTYFQAMQWLQLAGLNHNDEQSLRRAVFMASMLGASSEAMEAYEDIDAIVGFLTGETDNISLLDIYNVLQAGGFNTPQQAQGDKAMAAVRQFIAETGQRSNRIKSKKANPSDSVINVMPARYVPDAQVLSRMSDEKPNAERAFPRGLDVMAAFGSRQAESLLTVFHKDQEAWSGWQKEMAHQKECFKGFAGNDADKTVYNKWLATLVRLQDSDKGKYPAVMRTGAWALKDVNTALASWAELKHDAILYAEQPMLAECGGGGCLPEPYVKGYVEPNVGFWTTMEELCNLTHDKLKRHNSLTEDLANKLESLHEMVSKLREISEKELAGQMLSEDEFWWISHIGASVEWMSLSLVSPDVSLMSWDNVEGADRSIACVADVFTRNIIGCDKCGILHAATGLADAIYVMVRMGDYYYLTRGAVLSYREFVEPLGSRLTDEQWQKRIEQKPRYGVPEWMAPIITGKQPKVDESIFYSSGC